MEKMFNKGLFLVWGGLGFLYALMDGAFGGGRHLFYYTSVYIFCVAVYTIVKAIEGKNENR